MGTKASVLEVLQTAPKTAWQYLEERPHPWRRQLYVKGRRLKAFSVWSDMIANHLTAEEIAQSRDLPLEAVRECVRYCEENRPLLEDECDQEKNWLLARGLTIEPPPAH
jgi:hypothetical protein